MAGERTVSCGAARCLLRFGKLGSSTGEPRGIGRKGARLAEKISPSLEKVISSLTKGAGLGENRRGNLADQISQAEARGQGFVELCAVLRGDVGLLNEESRGSVWRDRRAFAGRTFAIVAAGFEKDDPNRLVGCSLGGGRFAEEEVMAVESGWKLRGRCLLHRERREGRCRFAAVQVNRC